MRFANRTISTIVGRDLHQVRERGCFRCGKWFEVWNADFGFEGFVKSREVEKRIATEYLVLILNGPFLRRAGSSRRKGPIIAQFLGGGGLTFDGVG